MYVDVHDHDASGSCVDVSTTTTRPRRFRKLGGHLYDHDTTHGTTEAAWTSLRPRHDTRHNGSCVHISMNARCTIQQKLGAHFHEHVTRHNMSSKDISVILRTAHVYPYMNNNRRSTKKCLAYGARSISLLCRRTPNPTVRV